MNAVYIRFDDGFFPFARACLNSLRSNFPEYPSLIVDYAGFDAATLEFLRVSGADLVGPSTPPEFAGAIRPHRGRAAVLDRFKLWRTDFRHYDTILHLDADTLVLGPLDELFADPSPCFVANHEADPEVRIFGRRHCNSVALRTMLEEDGLAQIDGADDMANAGVFTLPYEHRSRRKLALLARLARRYGPYLAFADQSLLSLWLRKIGHAPRRDFRFNYQTPFLTDPSVDVTFDEVRVLHFSSHRKPGTAAFDRWERVGPLRPRLIELFRRYRDMQP